MNSKIFTCVDAATGETIWRSRSCRSPAIVGDMIGFRREDAMTTSGRYEFLPLLRLGSSPTLPSAMASLSTTRNP